MYDQENNPKKAKYNNVRTKIGTVEFASKLEASVWKHLKFKEDHGLIRGLKLQPNVVLTLAEIKCRPDFLFLTQDGLLRYAEAKGCETERWRLIKQLWRKYGPAPLEIYKGTRRGIYLCETIVPDPRMTQLNLQV